jgi:hypothetical protein
MIVQVGNNFSQSFSGINYVVRGIHQDGEYFYDSKSFLSFVKTVRINKECLIIVHGIFNIYSLIIPLFFYSQKLHLILHGQSQYETRSLKKWFWNKFLVSIIHKYDVIQYLSLNERANCKLNLNHQNTTIIPNGISIPTLKPVSSFNKKIKVLYIGRIDETQKGLLSFFKLKPRLDFEFHVYGPNSKTCALLKDLHLNNLFIHNPVYDKSEKEKLFLSHDFAILPSHFEGFPIFALECMAHGLHLFHTINCNLWEIKNISERTECTDSLDMIRRIDNLKIDDLDRLHLFNRGRESVNHLNWDTIRKTILSKHS